MQGRYGLDRLSQVMMIVGLVVVIIAAFVRRPVIVSNLIYLVGIVIVILGYIRVFSKNYQKRYNAVSYTHLDVYKRQIKSFAVKKT